MYLAREYLRAKYIVRYMYKFHKIFVEIFCEIFITKNFKKICIPKP